MTNSTQTTRQPESEKEIPELSLEQLQQVSGGATIFVEDARVGRPAVPAATIFVE